MSVDASTAAWSVPGRVNLIGEHVDYNGGPVLPFAIDRRTEVRVRPRPDERVIVTSEGHGVAELFDDRGLRGPGVSGWVRYVAAALDALTERTGQISRGFDIEISSSIPVGAGLSSSAALECGVVAGVSDVADLRLSPRQVAETALRAERAYVGVPCGPMDQLAVMLGAPDRASLIDSQTLEVTPIPLPLAAQGLGVTVIETGVQHAVGESPYAARHTECAAAARQLGLEWLADATAEQVETLTDPHQRRRARHVVSETARVHETVRLLRAGAPADIGELLTASHESLAGDFEVSCRELDLAVSAALDAGARGARMTGAGFGGCAIALCASVDEDRVSRGVRAAFAAAGLREPAVWSATPAAGARRVLG